MMKKLLFLLALIPFFTECKSESAAAQADDESPASQTNATAKYAYYYDEDKELHGIMDMTGKVIVDARWPDAPSVGINDRVWVWNSKTSKQELYTIEPKPRKLAEHYQAAAFVTDVAPVCDNNGYVQFIDANGKVKFTLDSFEGKPVSFVSNFHEGICQVRTRDGMTGAIDKDGKTVIKPVYTLMSEVCNGKILACEEKYNDEVIESCFLTPDSDGEALMCKVKMVVLDLKGKKLGEIDMAKYNGFYLDLYGDYIRVILDEEGTEALVDIQGKTVVKLEDNTYFQTISDGMYVYSMYDDSQQGYHTGVRDIATGKDVVPTDGTYQYMELACDGGWIFCGDIDTGYTLVNRDGRKILENELSVTSQFSNGILCVAKKSGESVIINVQGDILGEIPKGLTMGGFPTYEVVESSHLDIDGLLKELQLQKDGFLGISTQTDIRKITDICRAQIMKYSSGSLIFAEYSTEDETHTHHIIEVGDLSLNIGMHFEGPFVERQEGYNIFRKGACPSFFGFCADISQCEMRGNARRLLEALKAKVRTFGTVEEEGKNAILVKTGENQGVLAAFDGYNVFVLFGEYGGVNFSPNNMFDTDEEDPTDYKDFSDLYIAVEG